MVCASLTDPYLVFSKVRLCRLELNCRSKQANKVALCLLLNCLHPATVQHLNER